MGCEESYFAEYVVKLFNNSLLEKIGKEIQDYSFWCKGWGRDFPAKYGQTWSFWLYP